MTITDVDSIKLTDRPSLAIVSKHQRLIGDRTPGRTLNRIVQAFEHSGMSLVPDNDFAHQPAPAPSDAETATPTA